MTAFVATLSTTTPARSPRLLGLRPVVAKEIHEWFANRRAWILLGVTTVMMLLNTLSARIAGTSLVGRDLPAGLSFDPTVNVLAKWDQWLFFFAITFTVSLLIVERDRGTLAWSLTKPLSRRALIVGKWLGAMAIYVPFGLVLPMVACVVAATLSYGTPDVGRVAVATVLLAGVPAFFIGLTLALATFLPSQSAVGGAAVLVAIAPGLVGAVFPSIAMALPPAIGSWAVGVALGGTVSALTPIGWLIGMVVVTLAGITIISRGDL